MTGTMIFVLGPHRSGTSLVAGMLDRLGVYMGPSWADEHNPTGYFEDRRFLAFHKQLVGYWWHPLVNGVTDAQKLAYRRLLRRRLSYDLHGVKDPRLCLLADMLIPLAGAQYDIKIVNVNRNVEAAVRSLVARNGLNEERARQLTVDHLEARADFVQGFDGDTLSVSYECVIDNPIKAARRLAGFVDVDDPQRIAHATQLVDPELNHHGR